LKKEIFDFKKSERRDLQKGKSKIIFFIRMLWQKTKIQTQFMSLKNFYDLTKEGVTRSRRKNCLKKFVLLLRDYEEDGVTMHTLGPMD